VTQPDHDSADAAIQREALRRLWPNRQHESNWIKNLLCRLGMHRWHHLDLDRLVPGEAADYCRRCPKIRFHGVVFE
jgi:hypothetical protein